jgi:hypothetical protein
MSERQPFSQTAIGFVLLSVIAGVLILWITRKDSEPTGQITSTIRDDVGRVSAQHSQSVPPPSPRPRPKPPKPFITRAGESITVGDLLFVMEKCGNTKDNWHWLKCEGKVINRGDNRLTLSFTGGTAIDDSGNQSGLATFLVGSMAGLFLGAGDNSSSELTPSVPVKFGFILKGTSYATAFNLDLRFSTSGQQPPTTGQITFTNIPVLE